MNKKIAFISKNDAAYRTFTIESSEENLIGGLGVTQEKHYQGRVTNNFSKTNEHIQVNSSKERWANIAKSKQSKLVQSYGVESKIMGSGVLIDQEHGTSSNQKKQITYLDDAFNQIHKDTTINTQSGLDMEHDLHLNYTTTLNMNFDKKRTRNSKEKALNKTQIIKPKISQDKRQIAGYNFTIYGKGRSKGSDSILEQDHIVENSLVSLTDDNSITMSKIADRKGSSGRNIYPGLGGRGYVYDMSRRAQNVKKLNQNCTGSQVNDNSLNLESPKGYNSEMIGYDDVISLRGYNNNSQQNKISTTFPNIADIMSSDSKQAYIHDKIKNIFPMNYNKSIDAFSSLVKNAKLVSNSQKKTNDLGNTRGYLDSRKGSGGALVEKIYNKYQYDDDNLDRIGAMTGMTNHKFFNKTKNKINSRAILDGMGLNSFKSSKSKTNIGFPVSDHLKKNPMHQISRTQASKFYEDSVITGSDYVEGKISKNQQSADIGSSSLNSARNSGDFTGFSGSEGQKQKERDLTKMYTTFYKNSHEIDQNGINFDQNPREEAMILKDFFKQMDELNKSKGLDPKDAVEKSSEMLDECVKDYVNLYTFINMTFIRRVKKECKEYSGFQSEISQRSIQFIKNITTTYKLREEKIQAESKKSEMDKTKEAMEKDFNVMLSKTVNFITEKYKTEIEVKDENYNKVTEKVRFYKKRSRNCEKREEKYLLRLNTQGKKLNQLKNMYTAAFERYELMKETACNSMEKLLILSAKQNDKEEVLKIRKFVENEKIEGVIDIGKVDDWLAHDHGDFHKADFVERTGINSSSCSHESLSDDTEFKMKQAWLKRNRQIHRVDEIHETNQFTSKKPFKLYKSPSFHKEYRTVSVLNRIERYIDVAHAGTETDDLIRLANIETQTRISQIDPKFDRIFTSMPKFEIWYKRSIFQKKLMELAKQPDKMHFIKDPKMRILLVSLYRSRNLTSHDNLDDEAFDAKFIVAPSMKHLEPEKRGSIDRGSFDLNVGSRLGIDKKEYEGLTTKQQVEDLVDSFAFEASKVEEQTRRLTTKEKSFTAQIEVTRRMKGKMSSLTHQIDEIKTYHDKFQKLHRKCNVSKEHQELMKRSAERTQEGLKSQRSQRSDHSGRSTKYDFVWKGKKPKYLMEKNSSEYKEMKKEQEDKKRLVISEKARAAEARVEDLIQRIKIFYSLKDSKNIKFIPLKSQYKMITNIWNEKVTQHRLNPDHCNQSIRSFSEEYFMMSYGESSNSQKRLREILVSSFFYKDNPRVMFFARFMRLLEDVKYSLFEEQMFLNAFDYMTMSNRGSPIAIDYEDGNHYFPVIRFQDYVRCHLRARLSESYMMLLRKEIQNKKLNDPRKDNPAGVLDFDLFMMAVFGVSRMCHADELTYLKAIFQSCDLNNDKTIEFNEMKIFFKRIEKVSEKESLKLLKESFELYADNFNKEKRQAAFAGLKGHKRKEAEAKSDMEKSQNVEQFVLFCSESRLFTKEKVYDFLGINAGDDIRMHYFEKKDCVQNAYPKLHAAIRSLKKKPNYWKNKWINILDHMRNNFMETEQTKVTEECAYKCLQQFTLIEYEIQKVKLFDELNEANLPGMNAQQLNRALMIEDYNENLHTLGMKYTDLINDNNAFEIKDELPPAIQVSDAHNDPKVKSMKQKRSSSKGDVSPKKKQQQSKIVEQVTEEKVSNAEDQLRLVDQWMQQKSAVTQLFNPLEADNDENILDKQIDDLGKPQNEMVLKLKADAEAMEKYLIYFYDKKQES